MDQDTPCRGDGSCKCGHHCSMPTSQQPLRTNWAAGLCRPPLIPPAFPLNHSLGNDLGETCTDWWGWHISCGLGNWLFLGSVTSPLAPIEGERNSPIASPAMEDARSAVAHSGSDKRPGCAPIFRETMDSWGPSVK